LDYNIPKVTLMMEDPHLDICLRFQVHLLVGEARNDHVLLSPQQKQSMRVTNISYPRNNRLLQLDEVNLQKEQSIPVTIYEDNQSAICMAKKSSVSWKKQMECRKWALDIRLLLFL